LIAFASKFRAIQQQVIHKDLSTLTKPASYAKKYMIGSYRKAKICLIYIVAINKEYNYNMLIQMQVEKMAVNIRLSRRDMDDFIFISVCVLSLNIVYMHALIIK
jgi:hypothetical protein